MSAGRTIVHISADFPDPLAPAKTRAIANLIDAAPEYRHVVYSLNRTVRGSGIACLPFGTDRYAMAYQAPDKGLFLKSRLSHVAEWIGAHLGETGVTPSLVHAHKLTVEGIAAIRIAGAVGCPLIVNIQGDSDTKISGARPDLRAQFRAIADASKAILSFAPWSRDAMAGILGPNIGKTSILPVITRNDRLMPSPGDASQRLVSLFHLDSWRRKGADTIARAAHIAARDFPELTVDIFGAGAPAALMDLQKVLGSADPGGRVRLRGPLARDAVQATLNSYAGFVMPSRRESYGLSYVEALFSGIPLIYSAGRGVDGLLPADVMGYRCDPSDSSDVAKGMVQILRQQKTIKQRIAVAQGNGDLDWLRQENIAAAYRWILAQNMRP